MDWEESFQDPYALVQGARDRLDLDSARIRYVNGRYKQKGMEETAWLFNISFHIEGDTLIILEEEQEKTYRIPLTELEYLKLRPFYFAACIGFKAFVFKMEG